MKIIDRQLYLEFKDLIRFGFGSENYLKKELSRGAKWAITIKDPSDMRKVLITYDSLPDNKKELITKLVGNPYDYFAKEPIRAMIERDTKAEEFFYSYRYDNNKALPVETIKKYTEAANWMNMLVKAQDDFKSIRDQIGIGAAAFWMAVADLIEKDGIALPSKHRPLIRKIKTYREEGYECLVSKKFGMKNNLKVDDETAEAVLLELISIPNSDDVLTARRYNTWAAQNGKDQITDRTVTNWKNKNRHLISQDKWGKKETYNVYGKHIHRARPSAPLLLVEHDDNDLDLYFQNTRTKGGRTEVFYYNRFVLAIVIDAFNDYILGWAIGETYTKDLIRFAYLDAVHHVHDLTGGWYMPHQIRSDRFGLDKDLKNDLAEFYKSLAVFTPATVKVARAKYIERTFGTPWHQALSLYKNYSGSNITSGKRVPEEFIETNKRDYPTVDQAPLQAAQFINNLRNLVNDKTGKSRQEEWIEAFHNSQKSKEKAITETQVLAKLGTPHNHLNKVTSAGISPSINCKDRTYEVPEELYMKTIGMQVQVIYDPMDYSRILVTNNKDVLFIAREQELMPSALADFKEGDRKKLNDRLAEKVRHFIEPAEKKNQRQDLLAMSKIEIESYLQAGIHTKATNEALQMAYNPTLIESNNKPRSASSRNINDVIDDL
ncbi:MAG: hypothetical protein J0M30_14655 [Chitinophagales bacterium]|nr:hypothetical protein [Chitinophagales bacterium]